MFFSFVLIQKKQKIKACKSNLENYCIKHSACQAVRLAGSTSGTLPLIDRFVFYVIDLMPRTVTGCFR